jgi:tetratricopeptide (TPR) repeat protein
MSKPALKTPAASAADLAAQAESAAARQDMIAAVRLIGESLAVDPQDPERLLRAAFFRTCLREYDEARGDLERAAALLGPKDARPPRALAHLEYVQGRYAPALKAACSIPSPYFQDDFLRGLLFARVGRADEARRVLEELRPRAGGWAHLLNAFQKALAGDWAEASAAADRAAASDKPLEQPDRLAGAQTAFRLKAWQTRTGADKSRPETDASQGRLRLISLGVDPPRHVTLDALQALSGCDVVFVNLASDSVMDLMTTFCPGEIRPINFVDEETRMACARQVFAALAPGKTVGYATYGHVMVYGPLTILIARYCRRKKIPVEAWAGVSIIDRVLADSGVVLGDGFGGFQLYDATEVSLPDTVLNGRAALAMYLTDRLSGDSPQFYARVQKRLLEAYPAEHEGLLWGPDGLVERLPVGKLASAAPRLGGHRQYFLPARPSV